MTPEFCVLHCAHSPLALVDVEDPEGVAHVVSLLLVFAQTLREDTTDAGQNNCRGGSNHVPL